MGKKITVEKNRRQTILRTEHLFTNSSCFFTNNALDFHLNNQKLGCLWFFFNLVPRVYLPKISFSWSNCLSARVYHCCFCAHLLKLTWHLSSYAWKSHTEKLCHTLFLLKAKRCWEYLLSTASELSSCQPLNCLQFFWGSNSCTEI